MKNKDFVCPAGTVSLSVFVNSSRYHVSIRFKPRDIANKASPMVVFNLYDESIFAPANEAICLWDKAVELGGQPGEDPKRVPACLGECADYLDMLGDRLEDHYSQMLGSACLSLVKSLAANVRGSNGQGS